ncbi:hypothetical protein CEXT_27671 [Caerostris extrusa]|uniref:Uncharacterized protein n=1 Tax=Caerostris extrusa TaxID=172846 RepID=A0AAV4UY53_CAEEX|nr:hypothetical protein CEXT_27671 [Caerostris extrusa]
MYFLPKILLGDSSRRFKNLFSPSKEIDRWRFSFPNSSSMPHDTRCRLEMPEEMASHRNKKTPSNIENDVLCFMFEQSTTGLKCCTLTIFDFEGDCDRMTNTP